jgi:hypothetical protein
MQLQFVLPHALNTTLLQCAAITAPAAAPAAANVAVTQPLKPSWDQDWQKRHHQRSFLDFKNHFCTIMIAVRTTFADTSYNFWRSRAVVRNAKKAILGFPTVAPRLL